MTLKNKHSSVGGISLRSHAVVVGGRQLSCNRKFATWWERHGHDTACGGYSCQEQPKRLIGTIKIGGALWSTLWVSTESEIASSSCERDMTTNARSPLNSFARSSRG